MLFFISSALNVRFVAGAIVFDVWHRPVRYVTAAVGGSGSTGSVTSTRKVAGELIKV
jgi:hypothetical protein